MNKYSFLKDLKYQLHYDCSTGIFTRKVTNNNSVRVGDIAGSIVRGYITICINGKRYLAHRLAWLYMTGKWPKNQIDHINHNRSDNKFSNLREVNAKINGKNQTIFKNNTSGVTGVSWCDKSNKWRTLISINGKNTHIGIFNSFKEAVDAREKAKVKYGYHENHGVKL